MRIHSFVAWVDTTGGLRAPASPPDGATIERRAGPLVLRYLPRDPGVPTAATHGEPLVVGDDAEFDPNAPDRNLASGVPLRIDEATRTLTIATSVIGLPPVYTFRANGLSAVTSDIHLLRQVPRLRLALDPQGVTELGRFGHPVEHRTLFTDVWLASAGHVLTLDADGGFESRATWDLPPHDPLSQAEFIERQMAVFTDAMRRIDVSSTFLSLTAGLDTRTVFAELANEGRLIPSVTMTGRRRSLDARIAERLARAYGVQHDLVVFDDRFARRLPELIDQASRLSGGHASLGQAPEVYLYDELGGAHRARLSGNLGNQVGRGGTEGVSVRDADLAILDPRLRTASGDDHWLLAKLGQDEHATLRYILTSEIAFSSVGNFSIGNHYAAQQSPYASRALIETLAGRPRRHSGPSASMLRMRLRDLRHRFLGEPATTSFQRTLVRRIGGAAARIPINWGWRPAGGVSAPGMIMGVATFAGMAARATGLDAGRLRRPLLWTGLPALHDFRDSRHWLRRDLREYVHDTLGARALGDAGLFDRSALKRILAAHYDGTADHYETITFALDIASAHVNFGR